MRLLWGHGEDLSVITKKEKHAEIMTGQRGEIKVMCTSQESGTRPSADTAEWEDGAMRARP